MKQIIPILVFFMCSFCVFSQEKDPYVKKVEKADSLFEYNRDSAIKQLNLLVRELSSLKKDYALAQAHKSLGRMYYFKADFPVALNHFQECDNLVEKNKFSDIDIQLRNLYGTFYKKQKQYDKAFEEFEKGLIKAKAVNDSAWIGGFFGDIGLVFAEQNQYAKAKPYFQQSLDIYLRTKNDLGASYAYDYLAESYAVEKNFDKAIDYMKKALAIREGLHNETLVAINLNNIGEIHVQNKDYKNAAFMLEKSIVMSRRLNFNDLLQHSLGLLSECYRNLGNYKLALEYNDQRNRLKDSIFNDHNSQIIQEAEGKYQSQKKQNQIDKLNAQNELNELQVSKQRNIILFFAIILAIVIIALITIFRYYGQLKKSNVIIRKQHEQTEYQKKIIEEKQHEILDSINYAKRIQSTLLAQKEFLTENLGADHFILFKPKDIVSGDFYWATQVERSSLESAEKQKDGSNTRTVSSYYFYLAVCDSTGHGVPGAFMSLLNIGYLSEAINEKQITDPGKIFNYTRDRLIDSVSKDGQQDGFDGVLLKIENTEGSRKITYSAAHNPPLLVSSNGYKVLPYDKMPVGIGEKKQSFTEHDFEYNNGDVLYLFTDGYADQFGGPKGKKFKFKQLAEFLVSIHKESAPRQQLLLEQKFIDWKGDLEQIDDVCIIGIRL